MGKEIRFITGSRKRISLPLLKWCPDPIVLVEPQEFEEYKKTHVTLEVYSHPKDNGGFSYLMNEVTRRTLLKGHKYFMFTDDDVTSIRERYFINDKFRKPQDIKKTLATMVSLAELHGLAQLSMSFSGQSWAAKQEMQPNVGAWGVHLTNAQAVQDVGGYDESLICFGDWDISARLIQAGYRTAKTNLISFVHTMKSHPGGAEDVYKQKEEVRRAADRMAAKFPGAATVKYIEAHGLYEPRLNWKKLQLK